MRNAGWKNHKLEARLLGETSITSDMEMTNSSRVKVLPGSYQIKIVE